MTSLTLRLAGPSDAYGLAEMHVAAWQSAFRGMLPDDFLDGLTVAGRAERWQQILTETARHVWVVSEAERIVGFVSIGASRDDDACPGQTGEIYAFYVHPDRWRHGIGSMLMAQALRELHRLGYVEATLWVLRGNMQAKSFYEAAGFVPDGGAKIDVNPAGISFDEVRYRRIVRDQAPMSPPVTIISTKEPNDADR